MKRLSEKLATRNSQLETRQNKKVIRGKNCSLVLFRNGDEKLVSMIHKLFNDTEIEEYLNPDYLRYRTKSKVRIWIGKKLKSPVDVWYVIRWKSHYIGYVCFKWREHYSEACEISTAILKEYRGLKLGYESSKLLIDYAASLKIFRWIVGYVHYDNIKAQNNLRKLGFRKNTLMRKKITMEFYNDDGTSEVGRRYVMFTFNARRQTFLTFDV